MRGLGLVAGTRGKPQIEGKRPQNYSFQFKQV